MELLKVYNQNLHTHGVLDDGKDEYEDTVKRAIELGFDCIGFAGHSHHAYSRACMTKEGTAAYKQEIARLKEKYAGVIDVYCGLELEAISPPEDLDPYDFVIGSVHYIHLGGGPVTIDCSIDRTRELVDEYFGGNGMGLVKQYYEELANLPNTIKRCDIVAHLDLIAKHAEHHDLFDTHSKEYRDYALMALDALAEAYNVFEINTGAIARGYRSMAYPDPFILKEIRKRNCNIVLSSDCHDKRYLNCYFNEMLALAKECGFREVLKYTKDGFVACPI